MMVVTSRLRKLALTAHIVSSVGWLGAFRRSRSCGEPNTAVGGAAFGARRDAA
jgi:hypothetical protein